MFARSIIGTLLLMTIAAGSIPLLRNGIYGLTLFVVSPILLGGIASWIRRPKTDKQAVNLGVGSALVALFALLLIRIEGIICILMVAPLAAGLAALGSWLVYRFDGPPSGARGVTALVLIPPISLLWDIKVQPPVFEVQSTVEINASPDEVWRHVIRFETLPEPTEWLFKTGIAYPKRARVDGSGAGAVRYCDFSTGSFVEPVEIWEAPRLLQFRVTESPAPMEEWNPFAKITPKHLHGYFLSRKGQFKLTPLPGNRTLLAGTTWYQHGLWPAQYWKWWSDAIIHRIHLRVLRHIRSLAEAPAV